MKIINVLNSKARKEVYEIFSAIDPEYIKQYGWEISYDKDGQYVGYTDSEGNFHHWYEQ